VDPGHRMFANQSVGFIRSGDLLVDDARSVISNHRNRRLGLCRVSNNDSRRRSRLGAATNSDGVGCLASAMLAAHGVISLSLWERAGVRVLWKTVRLTLSTTDVPGHSL